MSILVTGGAGYIGSHTCVELLNAGKDIVVLDNFVNSKPEALKRIREITGKDFKFYEADLLRQSRRWSGCSSENQIDAVIHFAGLKAVGESCAHSAARTIATTSTGTLVLCEVMRGARLQRASSSAPPPPSTAWRIPCPFREDMPLPHAATNPYGTHQALYRADPHGSVRRPIPTW